MKKLAPFFSNWTTFWVVCVSSFASHLAAQHSTTEFAYGPLQDGAEAMRNLIVLRLDGNCLAMRREWNEESRDEFAENPEAARDKLIRHGIVPVLVDRMNPQAFRVASFDHPMLNAFYQLRNGIHSGSSGKSGSANRWRVHFNNRVLAGRAELSQSRIKITVKENLAPKRTVAVEDNNNGQFSFKYSGLDFQFALTQNADDSIQLSRNRNDEAELFTADSYAGLQRKHPEVVDRWLVPVFEHIGFSIPVFAHDKAVQKAVLDRLLTIDNQSRGEFKKKIADLDADEFATRDNATQRLIAQADSWKDAIQKELESRDLSPEVRVRLKKVLNESSSESQIEELIRTQDLLKSPAYLISLFDIADEVQASTIQQRLLELTGKPQLNPESWRKWFKDKGESDQAKDGSN